MPRHDHERSTGPRHRPWGDEGLLRRHRLGRRRPVALEAAVARERTAVSFDALAALATDTVRAGGLAWADVRAAGVVVPGIYDTATGRAWAPNLWGRDEVQLLGELRERLPVPVVIDSDRWGTSSARPGRARPRAAPTSCSSPWAPASAPASCPTAASSAAMEGSRVPSAVALDPRWRDAYGRMGAFEAEAAGPALARRFGGASAEAVAEAARGGDPAACRAVAETVEWLAMGTANLISAFNPQVVVLGGGLMQAADLFLEPVRRAVRRWAQPLAAEQCRVELTRLGEDAALFGAARLASLEESS